MRCNAREGVGPGMARATLTISSKNYSSWSLRGWLLCRMAGLDFEEQPVDLGDPRRAAGAPAAVAVGAGAAADARRRGLGLGHARDRGIPQRDRAGGQAPARRPGGARALPGGVGRDPLGLLQPALGAADEPQGAARERSRSSPARGRTSSGSARSGASASRATAGRSCSARRRWRTRCTRRSARGSAPTRSRSTRGCRRYCDTVFAWPLMQEWTEGALAEADEIIELEVEF